MVPQAGMQPVPGLTLTQQLGNGAFADVWEAVRADRSRVALKFLDCRKRGASMVATEVRILRGLTTLQHPNIIPLHAVHAWGQFVVLVLERADGNLEDLRQAYQQHANSNVPPDHALDLLAQAADALDFIASLRQTGLSGSRGLQHCDIKPSNLLLVGQTLKVADFGLSAGAGWNTTNGGWKGTPPYAAPELYGSAATVGTDQFALAVTFCAIVMGGRPFWNRADLASTPPAGTPIDLTRLREKEMPIITRALHRYPSSRWPSCRAFIDELRKVNDKPRGATRIFPRGLHGSIRNGSTLQFTNTR